MIQQDIFEQQTNNHWHRPTDFATFVGQEHIKKVLQTAIISAQKNEHTLGHILFAWPSGYGKTTLAELLSQQLGKNFFQVTAYAITKPAEIISLLQKLQKDDILFIDEIHRIPSKLEEILYIAMEDHRIDMILPDGTNLSLPLQQFTLVGATTQPEKLTSPLKNRFVYNFSFMPYTQPEKENIIQHYLAYNNIECSDTWLVGDISQKVESVPRQIKNLCTQLRDFLLSINDGAKKLTQSSRTGFVNRLELEDGWISHIHKEYLKILEGTSWPVWLKTISIQLWMNEKAVEDDVEPLLFKTGKIEKTSRGRVLKKN